MITHGSRPSSSSLSSSTGGSSRATGERNQRPQQDTAFEKDSNREEITHYDQVLPKISYPNTLLTGGARESMDRTSCVGITNWPYKISTQNEKNWKTVKLFLVHIYRRMSCKGLYVGIGYIKDEWISDDDDDNKQHSYQGRGMKRRPSSSAIQRRWVEICFPPVYFERCTRPIEEEMIRLNFCELSDIQVVELPPKDVSEEDFIFLRRSPDLPRYAPYGFDEEDEKLQFRMFLVIPQEIKDSQIEHTLRPIASLPWKRPQDDYLLLGNAENLKLTRFEMQEFFLSAPPEKLLLEKSNRGDSKPSQQQQQQQQQQKYVNQTIRNTLFFVKALPVEMDEIIPLESYPLIIEKVDKTEVSHCEISTTLPTLCHIQVRSGDWIKKFLKQKI